MCAHPRRLQPTRRGLRLTALFGGPLWVEVQTPRGPSVLLFFFFFQIRAVLIAFLWIVASPPPLVCVDFHEMDHL